jgi:hypothetical protein
MHRAFLLAMGMIMAMTLGTKQAAASCQTNEGADFVSRIQIYNNPSLTSLTAQMQTDLLNAYCNAPDFFRHHIDAVDYIYIDATGCGANWASCPAISGESLYSWGRRLAGGYTMIGIPAAIWPSTTTTIPITQYETGALQYLIQLPLLGGGGNYSSANDYPYFPNPSSGFLTNTWLTPLAALAHELGHVRWYEVSARSGYGQPFDFYKLTYDPAASRREHCKVGSLSSSGTNPGFFAGWASQSLGNLVSNIRWRYFGTPQDEHAQAPTFATDYAHATTDLSKEQLINLLYSSSQPWASYLAALSPEEDFVETYKFGTLAGAGITSMQLQVPLVTASPPPPPDVYADYTNGNKPLLKDKVKCLKGVQ